jgi:hypothetical protein
MKVRELIKALADMDQDAMPKLVDPDDQYDEDFDEDDHPEIVVLSARGY